MKKNLVLFAIVFLSICIGYLLGSEKEILMSNQQDSWSMNRLERLLQYIDNDYVEEIDTDSLVGEVIEDIVNRLDPHSVYIPAHHRQSIAENMQGNFYGIGVSFLMFKDSVTIIRVLEGGPSEAAGLLAGDRILIADKDTLFQKNYSSEKIMQTLKGRPGTSVDLTIYRKSEDKIFQLEMKRGKVPLPSVDSYYMMEKTVGYLKINRFSQTTYNEFDLALDDLISQGMKKMILDLRDNPGGYLHPAIQISNALLQKDQTIVITKSNMGEEERSLAEGNGNFQEGDLIVLVNGQSASASEIVAGAVQDNDRGWIIGRRTFGKGLVQQQMPLGGGDAVRLTIAKYFTPTGRSIQKPYNGDREAYDQDLSNRYHNGEMADAKKIPVTDSLAYKTPKGRTVFGGGGITPDFYISNKNTEQEEWNSLLLNSNMMNNFVFEELDKNRKKFNDFAMVDILEGQFEDLLPWHDLFVKYCADKQVEVTIEEWETLRAVKAYLGLQLFGENTFNQIKNQHDLFLETAISTLDSLSKFN
ncbi:MAG: S41 family peptidase [Flavobacteriaceae bacterium]|jgi:carboxyl-terminal processing protease